MTLSIILTLILCGLICNMMSAIFGIGGGVLIVPLLRTLFPDFPMQMIAASSLTIVMGTAMINLILFRKQNIEINVKHLIYWSIGMLAGVQIGFECSFLMPDAWISLIFIITLLILALKTLLTSRNQENFSENRPRFEQWKGLFICLFGGSVAGVTGIGGGSIMAPLIGQLRSVKTKQIAIYTNSMMVIGGVGNLYGYLSKPAPVATHAWQIGYVDFGVVAIVIVSSLLMSFFSMKLRNLLTPQLTKRLLALILLLIAGYMAIISF